MSISFNFLRFTVLFEKPTVVAMVSWKGARRYGCPSSWGVTRIGHASLLFVYAFVTLASMALEVMFFMIVARHAITLFTLVLVLGGFLCFLGLWTL